MDFTEGRKKDTEKTIIDKIRRDNRIKGGGVRYFLGLTLFILVKAKHRNNPSFCRSSACLYYTVVWRIHFISQKLLLYLTFVIFVLGLVLTDTTLAQPANLYARWPLNEGEGEVVFDISGNDLHGMIQNADNGLGPDGSVWVEDPVCGTVISFNGTADGAFVRAGEIPKMTLTNDFTWAFWAKHNAEWTRMQSILCRVSSLSSLRLNSSGT